MGKHDVLLGVWFDVNFGLSKKWCDDCNGFDPLEIPPRKVYNVYGKPLCLECIKTRMQSVLKESE